MVPKNHEALRKREGGRKYMDCYRGVYRAHYRFTGERAVQCVPEGFKGFGAVTYGWWGVQCCNKNVAASVSACLKT